MSKKSKVIALVAMASAMAFAGPVSHFGKLVSCGNNGNNICGEKTGNSTPIQLKGPSLYWSTGTPAAMYSTVAVDWFVNNFNISVIRAPMAIRYYKENSEPISASDGNPGVSSFGYLSKDPSGTGQYKAMQKALMKLIVDQAIVDDIYVMVDWHSHNAQNETNDAVAFFREMATEYKDVPNLIWEIYNEPVSASADQIHSYAQSVAGAIRGAGNDNLIIVGSNFYSSNPGQQASMGLHNTYKNIAYTLHFYAGANHDGYRNNLASGAPTFVTEWGATGADGDGYVNDASTWRDWMDQNKISGCMWFAGNDGQSSAMFPADANPTNLDNYKSRFSGTNTTAGVFNAFMSTNKWTSFVPSSHPLGKTFQHTLSEGKSVTFSSSDLGLRGSISSATTAYGTVSFTDNSITFQSKPFGSPEYVDIIYKVKSGSVEIQEKILIKFVDRKPSLKDTTIAVSHKAVSKFTLLKLRASDPVTGATNSLKLLGATATKGSASVSGDTIVYEPAGDGLAVVNYTVSNANGTSEGTLTLDCKNMAPTIYGQSSMTVANTERAMISLHRVRGKDADGDSIWFKAWNKGGFPGTLELNRTGDTLIYTPEANRTGTVTVLAVLTDGLLDSKVGEINIKLTGAGASFDGTIPVPTSIDGYVPPEGSDAIVKLKQPVLSGLMVKNRQVLFSIPQAKFVSLDLFDMKGHKVQTLARETMSAGSHAVDIGSLPKGMYVIRFRYGSQMKSVRFMSR